VRYWFRSFLADGGRQDWTSPSWKGCWGRARDAPLPRFSRLAHSAFISTESDFFSFVSVSNARLVAFRCSTTERRSTNFPSRKPILYQHRSRRTDSNTRGPVILSCPSLRLYQMRLYAAARSAKFIRTQAGCDRLYHSRQRTQCSQHSSFFILNTAAAVGQIR